MLNPDTILQTRYRILRLLGQGGMGAVYQAQDLRLNQIVALKENLGGDARQFQQEALLLANLRHPNLPRVSDHFIEPSGAQYLVMDFVEGEDLQSRLDRQGALPNAQVLAWFDQILDAVAYLHSRGVIHRDIKPANIKITPDGKAMLVDFGIAKVYQPGRSTTTGARAATPGYAAPEQYGGGTDARSDIYSLGATLYALLTGRVPPDALTLASGTALLVPPRRFTPVLNPQLERTILQAMSAQPAGRFSSAEQLRRALRGAPIGATTVPRITAPAITLPQTLPRLPSDRLIIALAAAAFGLLVLLGCGGVVWAVGGWLPGPTRTATGSPTPTPTRAPATGSAAPPNLTPTRTPMLTPTFTTLTPVPTSTSTLTSGAPTPTFTATRAAPPTPAPPTPAPPTLAPPASACGRIVFVSNRDGNGEIYSMDADGSNVTRLTNSYQDEAQSAWSQDGTHIAYLSKVDSSYFQIWVMNADGSNPRRVTYRDFDDWHPSWSPDGKQLVFHSLRSGNTSLWVINAGGDERTSPPRDLKVSEGWNPSWSPDGTRIAYNYTGKNIDIYALILATGQRVPLATDPTKDRNAAWSRDGRRIAFTSLRAGLSHIFVMNADGSGVFQLTPTRDPAGDDAATWSPDGRTVAFTSGNDPASPSSTDIWTIGADGSGLRNLTNSPDANNRDPNWSPKSCP